MLFFSVQLRANITPVDLVWQQLDKHDVIIDKSNPERIYWVLYLPKGHWFKAAVNEDETQLFFSNGSGLFQKVKPLIKNGLIYHNDSGESGWLKIISEQQQKPKIYQAPPIHYRYQDFMLDQRLQKIAAKHLSEAYKKSDLKSVQEMAVVSPNNPFSVYINEPGLVLFRHQLDYQQVTGSFDVHYTINWQGPNLKGSSNHSVRPQLNRVYKGQCWRQLGHEKMTWVRAEEVGWYHFNSNKNVLANVFVMNESQVVFSHNNKQFKSTNNNFIDSQALQFIANHMNLFIDQNLFVDAISKLVTNSKNRDIYHFLRGLYSFQKKLHPTSAKNQKALFAYHKVKLIPAGVEPPSELYINNDLIDDLNNKLPAGAFYQLSQGGLSYEIPTWMFERKLRISLANYFNTGPIKVVFDTGEEIKLYAEDAMNDIPLKVDTVDVGLSALNQVEGHQISTVADAFSATRQAAPYLKTVTGKIKIPADAKSFKIVGSNQIRVALSYPQLKFFRHGEYEVLKKALSFDYKESRSELFLDLYRHYKNIDNKALDFYALQKEVVNSGIDQEINFDQWVPYFRELLSVESSIPLNVNETVELPGLAELIVTVSELKNNQQYNQILKLLRVNFYHSTKQEVRQYSWNYLKANYEEQGLHRQLLSLAMVAYVRHKEHSMTTLIAQIYQKLNHHKKAVFYMSLLPNHADKEYVLASLFKLNQWKVFELYLKNSPNISSWQSLRSFANGESKQLSQAAVQLIDHFGYVWVTDDVSNLGYDHSKILSTLPTLGHKQVNFVDTKKSVEILVEGPAKIKLKLAKIFNNNSYSNTEHTVVLQGADVTKKFLFSSRPSLNWFGQDNHIIGSFGDVELDVPEGKHRFKVNTESGQALFYLTRREMVLGINLNRVENLDVKFFKNNHEKPINSEFSHAKVKGYIKLGCDELLPITPLLGSSVKPQEFDFERRDQWIDEADLDSGLSISQPHLVNAEKTTCGASAKLAKACIKNLLPLLQKRNLQTAIEILSLVDLYPDKGLMQYREEVFKYFKWSLKNNDINSDGKASIRYNFTPPESKYLKSLLTLNDQQLTQLYVNQNRTQGITLNDPPKELKVSLSRLSSSQVLWEPLQLYYQINENQPLVINMTDKRHDFTVMTDDETKVLKFWLDANKNNDWVMLEINDIKIPKVEKDYFVATKIKPIQLKVTNTQRIKVIKEKLTGVRTIDEFVAYAEHPSVTFDSQDSETYYRFFELKPDFQLNSHRTVVFDSVAKSNIVEAKKGNKNKTNSGVFMEPKVENINTIENPRKSTFEGGLLYGNGLDSEQENDVDISRYFAFIAAHRFHDTKRENYWSSDSQLRFGDNYEALYAGHRFDSVPSDLPWRYGGSLSGWLYRDENQSFTQHQLNAFISYQFNYHQRHRFNTRASLTHRNVSTDKFLSDEITVVPTDIWSSYKNNHKNALSLSQSWRHTFLKDLQLFSSIGLRSNENLRSVDHYQGVLGAGLLYDTLSLESSLVHRVYASDEHRERQLSSNRFHLEADWLFKQSNDGVFKFGIEYYKNFSNSIDSLQLTLTWLFHSGNRLQDYRPGEFRFKKLRSEFITQKILQDNIEN